jgi:hypothetical protein
LRPFLHRILGGVARAPLDDPRRSSRERSGSKWRPTWPPRYSERQLYYHSAQVWTHTGDFDDVAEAYRRGIGLYSPSEYLDLTLMGFDECLRVIRQGDAQAAVENATRIVTAVPGGQRTEIIKVGARAVLSSLPATTSRAALQEFREVLALGSG